MTERDICKSYRTLASDDFDAEGHPSGDSRRRSLLMIDVHPSPTNARHNRVSKDVPSTRNRHNE